jgi:hypothetical protein
MKCFSLIRKFSTHSVSHADLHELIDFADTAPEEQKTLRIMALIDDYNCFVIHSEILTDKRADTVGQELIYVLSHYPASACSAAGVRMCMCRRQFWMSSYNV